MASTASVPTSSQCLAVQVPVSNSGTQVDPVALGVSAGVCVFAGAVIALIASWLYFRYCFRKTEKKVSPSDDHQEKASASPSHGSKGRAGRITRETVDDGRNDDGLVFHGELRPVILQSLKTDDRAQHGMLDVISLTSEADVLIEISRQDVESILRLERGLREARINIVLLLTSGLLHSLRADKRLNQQDMKEFLASAFSRAQQFISTSQTTVNAEEEELRKKTKNADVLDLEIRRMHQKHAFSMSLELVHHIKENLRRDLIKAFELTEEEIDVAMRNMMNALTKLDAVMAADMRKHIAYLEEMREQRTNYVKMMLANHADRPAELENRKLALSSVLSAQKAEGKLTDKVIKGIESQYSSDLKSLLDKLDAELRNQSTNMIVKLRETRAEKMASIYEKYRKQLTSYFQTVSKATNLKEITDTFIALVQSLNSDRDSLCEDIDQREVKMLDAVNKRSKATYGVLYNLAKQGLDETWQKEVEQVDEKLRESLRTKAHLSERELEKANRHFLQELQQLQKIRHIEKREFIQIMQEKLKDAQRSVETMQMREQNDQQMLRAARDTLLSNVFKLQIGLGDEAKKTILKDHDELIAMILSYLQLNKLYWNKFLEYRLNVKQKQLNELKRQLDALPADDKTNTKANKAIQKQAQQLEKAIKDEETKLQLVVAAEESSVRNQIEADTCDAMSQHEKQLAVIIGRLLTRHARKQVAPTASSDPVVDKLQENLIKFVASNDVRLSPVALDSVLQQYKNEINVLMDQLNGARQRQLRAMNDRLEQRKLQQQREIQTRLQSEAAQEWKLQKRQNNSGLLMELSRCFFQQQYQRAVSELENETSVEKEQTKEELQEDLNVELQRQLKEKRMSLCANLMAIGKLTNNDISDVAFKAVRETGGDDKLAAKFTRELYALVQRVRTDRDYEQPQTKSQQRWPKTDQEYMSSTSTTTRPSSSVQRPRSNSGFTDEYVSSKAAAAQRSKMDDDYSNGRRSRTDDDYPIRGAAVKSRFDDEYPGSQRSSATSRSRMDDDYSQQRSTADSDRLRRSKTDMPSYSSQLPAIPRLDPLRRSQTEYGGRYNQSYENSENDDDDDQRDSDIPDYKSKSATSYASRPRSAVTRSKEI